MTTGAAWPAFKTEEGRTRYLAAYDAALAAWPAPYEELDVPTSFGTTHVVASGREGAPAVVLLPSFAATATVWRPNVEALGRLFRLYAVDVIGQPGRSLATRRLRSRRDFAAWYGALLDELGVGRASIVGCSFGGFLALSQASLTPSRVDKVVLISPAGTFVRMTLGVVLLMLSAPLRRRLRRLMGDQRAPNVQALRGMGAPPHAEDAAWRKLMSTTMSEGAKVNTINADVLSRREVRAVKAPTLLLIGELERLYEPHAAIATARERMPQITAEVVPGADHIAAMAQPEAVNARILAFLAGDGGG